jgi:endonuclease/exonuclease/phosphatase family metal-dependent hydrolase
MDSTPSISGPAPEASAPASATLAVGRLLGGATWGYAAGLVLLLAGMEWIGERNWIFSILIFLPPYLWLLPLGILLPACCFFRPKLCLAHLACAVWVVFIYMNFRWSPRPETRETGLTFVTNNAGQNNRQSLQPFVRAENPDVIALQETPAGRARGYAREYPGFFAKGCAEFILISKYPIIGCAPIRQPNWLGRPVAARFELSVRGRPLVVYNVHLPTPRPDFMKLRGFGLAREMLGKEWNRKRSDGRSYSESMVARVALAKNLAQQISEEKEPYVVMGDFNMPDHGAVYHIFASKFSDAFSLCGRGWGLTFPGYSGHFFTLFGPWLRLDYLFAGKGWEPVYCRTEPGRTSQHRAVAARFEPKPGH